MRKLLISLLAALALPTAVNAENANYYLLAQTLYKSFVVPMPTLGICQEAGKRFMDKSKWGGRQFNDSNMAYICVRAK